MTDSEFKNLPHCVGDNRVATRGNEVVHGYKPDVTVEDPEGHLVFILEHENKTDRKAFLGNVVKAEECAECQSSTPTLIIVMKARGNTTVPQIAQHLSRYSTWLAGLKGGRMSLSSICIIEEQEYSDSLTAKEVMGSQAFRARSTCSPVSERSK